MLQTVPVKVSDEALQEIQEFASRQGKITPTLLLSSIAEFYTEWYIPAMSFDPVMGPKKMCLRE